MSRITVVVGLCMAGWVVAAASAAATTGPAVDLQTVRLTTMPAAASRSTPIVTADGNHIACVVRAEPGRMTVMLDGKVVGSHPWILPHSLVIAPDSRRMAYVVQANNTMLVQLDGQAGPAFHELDTAGVVFSPDSQRVAYRASRGSDQWQIIIDGTPGKTYTQVGRPQFSPDSRRYAYLATTGKQWFYVIDGKEHGPFEGAMLGCPVFSPDSQRVGYGIKQNGKMRMVIDGKEGPVFDELALGTPIFSPNSQRVAYAGLRDGKALFVIDGVESAPYDTLGLPAFSPDSKRMACAVGKDGRRRMWLDGQEIGQYDTASVALFSPDSRRVAWRAGRGKQSLVVLDQQEGPLHEAVLDTSMIFSPDSKRFAYIYRPEATSERSVAMVDAKPQATYDLIAPLPVFSPDSRRVVYGARRQRQGMLVIDGQEVGSFDVLVGWPLLFAGNDTFSTLALSGEQVLKITARLKPQ